MIEFEFDPPVEYVKNVGLLNVEQPSIIQIAFIGEGGEVEDTNVILPILGVNSYQLLPLDVGEVTGSVKKVTLVMTSSAAVSSLAFCYPPVTTPAAISDIIPASQASGSSPTQVSPFDQSLSLAFGIESFVLVNAETNEDIVNAFDSCDPVSDCFGSATSFNIRAEVFGVVQGVDLSITGPVTAEKTEVFVPYAIFSDIDGDYAGFALPGAFGNILCSYAEYLYTVLIVILPSHFSRTVHHHC